MWEEEPVPWAGDPHGGKTEPVPTRPTPPQPPSSREAVIVIFCHLLGKLQVLLLPLSPLLGMRAGGGGLRTSRGLVVCTQPDPPRLLRTSQALTWSAPSPTRPGFPETPASTQSRKQLTSADSKSLL